MWRKARFPSFASYEEEKQYSALVDEWFGLSVTQTEKTIMKIEAQELWTHVPSSTMLTPYPELRRVLLFLAQQWQKEADELVVDLGAGYGRMGFVIQMCFSFRFLGYELVVERVRQAQKAFFAFGCDRAEIRELDLAAVSPEEADHYFLYDFGTRVVVNKTLGDLQKIARNRPITVVARGRLSRDLIEREHPWLSARQHEAHYSFYRSDGE